MRLLFVLADAGVSADFLVAFFLPVAFEDAGADSLLEGAGAGAGAGPSSIACLLAGGSATGAGAGRFLDPPCAGSEIY